MTNLAATSLPARARGGGELIRTVSNFSGTMRPFEGSLEPCGSATLFALCPRGQPPGTDLQPPPRLLVSVLVAVSQ